MMQSRPTGLGSGTFLLWQYPTGTGSYYGNVYEAHRLGEWGGTWQVGVALVGQLKGDPYV